MRSPSQDFIDGVLVGLAVQGLAVYLQQHGAKLGSEEEWYERVEREVERPGFRAAILQQRARSALARRVWGAWRKAEQVKLEVNDPAGFKTPENGSVET